MRIISALFAALLMACTSVAPTRAFACTNSYDTASDGSRCGQRASGCRSGGQGGYC
jgi:hypothetical protein